MLEKNEVLEGLAAKNISRIYSCYGWAKVKDIADDILCEMMKGGYTKTAGGDLVGDAFTIIENHLQIIPNYLFIYIDWCGLAAYLGRYIPFEVDESMLDAKGDWLMQEMFINEFTQFVKPIIIANRIPYNTVYKPVFDEIYHCLEAQHQYITTFGK